MIFNLIAPANKEVTNQLKQFFLEKGVDETTAKMWADELRDHVFMITDAEVSHRFPDYIGVNDFDETIDIGGTIDMDTPDSELDPNINYNIKSLGCFRIDENGIIKNVTIDKTET